MLNLPNNEVHLWLVDELEVEDVTLLQSYQALLNPAEQIRHQRFVFAKHQRQFLLTRALVRSVLAQYSAGLGAESDPVKLAFVNNAYGKPALANFPSEPKLHFNLTHSEDLIVLAVSLQEYMGVDVEYQTRKVEVLNLAERFFSPTEYSELQALPEAEKKERFFDLWTLKESYIKACGMGLSIPLDEFSFSFPDDNIAISFVPELKDQRQDSAEGWCFWQLQTENARSKIALGIKSAEAQGTKILCRRGLPLQGFSEVELTLLRQTAG